MARKTTHRPDQSEGLWEAVEANPDELQAYVAGRLGHLPAADAPTEPARFKAAFEASWPHVLAQADAER